MNSCYKATFITSSILMFLVAGLGLFAQIYRMSGYSYDAFRNEFLNSFQLTISSIFLVGSFLTLTLVTESRRDDDDVTDGCVISFFSLFACLVSTRVIHDLSVFVCAYEIVIL